MKLIVNRYRILTTPHVKYQVLEKYSDHSMIHTTSMGQMGEVMSRRTPEWMRKLPAGMERYDKVHGWYNNLKAVCMVAIFKAYPHLHNVTDNQVFSIDGTISEFWPTEADAINSFDIYSGMVEVEVDEVTVSA